MKKHIALIILGILLITNAVFAQEGGYDDFRAKMASVFQYVNKDKVPTGILSDYGLLLVEPNGFDGIPTDTNYVDLNVWKQLYFGMYDSRINTKTDLQEPQLLYDHIKGRSSLAVMHLYYSKLDDAAVSKGLLRFENEQIREVIGAASPYLQKELFVVSPCNTYFNSGTVSFTFDRQSYVSNTGLAVTRLEVKFGDESGYVEAQWGTPVSYVFASGGEKDICFRMNFSNGKSLISRTKITVDKPAPITRADGAPIEIISYDVPATASHSGGTMQVVFCNEATKGKFIRPLIIAEEVDIPMFYEDEKIDMATLFEDNLELAPILSQLSQIYDIIYIDNKNGLDDVNRNAALFKDVIDRVNGNLFNVFGTTIADSTYVVGLGMGGLVARIALNMMELTGEQHRVRKLITVNTPYKGLNLPVGIQAFVRHMKGFKIGESKMGDLSGKIDQIEKLLDSKAMQQMLIYSVASNMEYNNDQHRNFMNSPHVIRTPLLCQTIAVSGGSREGKKLFSPESLLVDYHGGKYIINQWYWNLIFLGNVNLKYDITAKTLPDRKSSNIYDGRFYIKKRILFWHVNINLTHRRMDSNWDMYPVDGASGNYLKMSELIKGSDLLGEVLKLDKFCLVPVVSALGLVNWQERLSASLQSTGENSMCNRYYVSGENNDCMDLFAFEDILISELTPKIVGNTTSIGQELNLFVDNMPDLSLINYTWNFRNKNFEVVSQTGSQAVIRPLHFGVTDAVSVTASIPFVNLSFNIPSVDVSSSILRIEGDTYISKLKNYYQLNHIPDCDTLFWRTSEGVIIDRSKGNNVVAHTEKELVGPWIEAVVRISGVETVFRKNLVSKGLKNVRLTRYCVWYGENDKGKVCKKYAYAVDYEPAEFPVERLDFCWSNTVQKPAEGQNRLGTSAGVPIANPYSNAGLAEMITKGGIGPFVCARSVIFPWDEWLTTEDDFVTQRDTIPYWGDFEQAGVFPRVANVPIGPPDPLIPLDNDDFYKDWGEVPDRVLVIMPILESGETASGILKCEVSDYINTSVLLESTELSVEGPRNSYYSYSLSSNPVNSTLTVSRTIVNSAAVSAFSAPLAPESLVVALHNNFGMVRSVIFDSSRASVDMNVSDLAEGTYYLNIIKSGNVIESRVVFIDH